MSLQLSDIQVQIKASADRLGARVAAARADIDALGRSRVQAVRRLAETGRAKVEQLQGDVTRLRGDAETRVKALVASGKAVLGTTAIERIRNQPLVARAIAWVESKKGKAA